MAQQSPRPWPFTTEVLGTMDGTGDALPATYHYYEPLGKNHKGRVVVDPVNGVPQFLDMELSLGYLGEILHHLWFAGSKHPATQLHFQVAMGREIIVADRIDLHLLWENNSRLFIKPIPRFLLYPSFWRDNLACAAGCACEVSQAAAYGSYAGKPPENQGPLAVPCRESLRRVALGFLYTYACLVSSESDFHVANDKRLLPRQADDSAITWAKWKELARELLKNHDPDKVHPRFLRAELRLSRINMISRFTRLPPIDLYLRGWRNYSILFRDNFIWMTAATVYVALVLTAMQVGLAIERLREDTGFQRASYGFTIFAILGPLCAFSLVALGALFNLAKDLPWLLRDKASQPQRQRRDIEN
ncbi:subtilisin-like serine protease [Ophiostoma piceae UAMH 11346]|uniref:Subtilisin-like serine protease n=1 Tax=Ophiostoma piceae (strain UAMH 11346) TaxID=1262450 RepID=S3C590_OPHP1|nr:subtilisin-like serine protease [Ophiostoma piceae UAMH 11346]